MIYVRIKKFIMGYFCRLSFQFFLRKHNEQYENFSERDKQRLAVSDLSAQKLIISMKTLLLYFININFY